MSVKIAVQLHEPRWKAVLRPHAKTVRAACEAALSPLSFGRRGGVSRGEGNAAKNPHPARDASHPFPEGEGIYELTVVLADDAFIRELNKTYRGKDKPTNVLSFPASSPESRIPNPETYLGDIVLAYETVMREAKEQKKKPRDHAVHLLVHGTLHLLGRDHEKKRAAEAMEAEEIKILKKLGVENPYL